MIDLNALAPFMLAAKTQDELKLIREAALNAVMAGVDRHAGLILHYASNLIK